MSKTFPSFRLKYTKLCTFVLAMFLVMSSETSRASAPFFTSGSSIPVVAVCAQFAGTQNFAGNLTITDTNPGATDTISVLSIVSSGSGPAGTVSNLPAVISGGTGVGPVSPIDYNIPAGGTGLRTISILVVSSAGGRDTIDIQFDLKLLPVVSITGDYNEVHVGEKINIVAYSATSGIGTWSTTSGGVNSSTSTDSMVGTGIIGRYARTTGIAVGTDNEIFTVGNICGSGSASYPVTVLTNISPVITATSGSAIPGSTLTITGTGFNVTPANNLVYFGGVRATLLSSTPTVLTVTVPFGVSYGNVTVLDNVSHLSATALYTFSPVFDSVAFQSSTYLNIRPGVVLSTNFSGASPGFLPGLDGDQLKPYSVEFGDIDGDGKVDIVVCGTGYDSIAVFKNTSTTGQITTASYAPAQYFKTRPIPINAKIVDIDADGKLDIVVACAGAGGVSIIRNTTTGGAISFALEFPVTTGGFLPNELSIGDFNRDGRPDIAVVHNGIDSIVHIAGVPHTFPGSVMILQNMYNRDTISGTFIDASSFRIDTIKIYPAFTSSPISMTSGDLDGDGKVDLVVSDHHQRKLEIFKNTSTGSAITFGAPSFVSTVRDLPGRLSAAQLTPDNYVTGYTDYPVQVRIGDLDANGLPELLVAVTDSDLLTSNVHNNLAVYKNNGTMTFGAKQLFPTGGASPVGIAIADMDVDGKPDAVFTNSGPGSVGIIRNTTTGGAINFAAPVLTANSPNAGPVSVAVADIDGNTVNDIVTVHRTFGRLVMYRQYPIPDTTSIIGTGDTICIGSSVTLTSTHGPNATGYWSSNQGNASVVGGVGPLDGSASVTGSVLGQDTIKYVVVHLFDTTFVTKRIFVKDTAHPGTITGPNNVCVGASISLLNPTATPVGTWSSSAPGIASVNSTTGVVTGMAAAGGTANIIYTTNTSLCGSLTATKAITVNTLPATGNVITGPTGVCVGSTITLTSTVVSGNWSSVNTALATVSPATGLITNVGGASVGLDTVRYIIQSASGLCGADTTIKEIAVVTSGSPLPITGTATVCQGSSTTLFNGASGGVWSSATGTVATVNAATGQVFGVLPGNETINYTINYCSAIVSTRVVTVNPAPVAAPITGPTSVCIGNTISLFNTGSVGTTTWTSNNPSAATVVSTTGVVTGVAGPGSTVITDSVTNSCGTVFTTQTVNVSATPTSPNITGAATVCPGGPSGTTTYTTSIGGGTWFSSVPGNASVATATATTATVTGITAGTTALISYSIATGCIAVSDTQTISILTLPNPGTILGADSICYGADTLSNASAVPNNGTWRSRDLLIATIGATTGIANRTDTGSFGNATIVYTNTNSCGSDSTTFLLRINPLANPGNITPSSTTVCQGGVITLTNPTGTPGGTWLSGAGTGSVSIAGNVATGVNPGPINIIYSISTVCGTQTPSFTATVRDTAIAIISGATTSLCVSSADITISSAGSQGSVGHSWNSSNPAAATINTVTGLLHPVGAGVTTLRYIADADCNSDTATLVFTVNTGANAGIITPAGSSVCSGANIPLNSSGDPVGTWSSSNTSVATVSASTSSSVSVFGVSVPSPTVVTIKYRTTNACNSDSVTTTVTVNPLPNAGTLSGTDSVCAGATTAFSTTGTSGTWNSSNPSVAAVNAITGVVTGSSSITLTSATASITYDVPNIGCGTASANRVVTVNPIPVAGTLSGSSTVCIGAVIPITSSGAVGTPHWSSQFTALATVDASGNVTGVAAGTTNITYAPTSGGCGTPFVTKSVTVNPVPNAGTLSGTDSVCAGATTAFSTTGSGGSWNSSNPSVAAVNAITGVVTGSSSVTLTSATASITYDVPNIGCGTASANRVVTVNPIPVAGTLSGSSTVCIGAVIPITSSGAVGTPHWSSQFTALATVDASGNVTGVAAGTTNITYAPTSGGCGTPFVTKSVTVTGTPSAGTISGTDTVCAGATTALSTTGSGGSWNSSNSSIAAVNAVTGVVTGSSSVTLTPATVTISYDVTTVGCGSASATRVVTVNPIPVAGTLSGASTVCVGAIIPITSSGAVGAPHWSSQFPAFATVDASGNVTGVAAGTTNITYAPTSGGCGSPFVTKSVTVNPLPNAGTISGTPTVCAGATTALSTTGTAGTWNTSNSAIATVNPSSGLVFGATGVLTSSTVTISYDVPSIGCGTASATQLVTVNPQPIATTITGSDTVCVSSSVVLTGAPSGATWSSVAGTGTASVGSTTGVVTGLTAGNLTISYTSTTACGTLASTHTMNVQPAATPGTISGSDSVCSGATTLWTYAPASPRHSWTSTNTSIATVNSFSGLVQGISPILATTTIVYTDTTYCGAVTVNKVIGVKELPNAGVIAGADSVCSGATTPMFNSAGLPPFAWSSLNASIAAVNSATGVVTGTSPSASFATTTIVYTASTFSCGSATSTHLITVKPLAVAGFISGPSTVCSPGSHTMTVIGASGGGTGSWTSSNGSVASAATATPTSGLISYPSGSVPGSTIITFSYTNSCNTDVATPFVLTVNSLPTAFINTHHNPITAPQLDTICVGVNRTYTGSSTGTAATSGTWSLSNNTIANITSVSSTSASIQALVAGTDTLRYIVANPCGPDTTYYKIRISPLPNAGNILGPGQLCQGDVVTYTNPTGDVNPAGAWSQSAGSFGTIFISPVTGVVNTVGGIGNVTITYTTPTGFCGSADTTFNIFVNPFLDPGTITGADTICANSSTTLNTSGIFGDIWSSSAPSIASVDAVTGVVTAPAGPGGMVDIYYTDNSFCGSETDTFSMFIRGLPSVGNIISLSGTNTMCVGASISLDNPTAPGGAWSSSATGIANVTTGGVVTGVSGGQTGIIYTLTNACGPNADTFDVVVNAYPVFTSATSKTVCDSELLSYVPTADSGSAAFAWTRAAVAGIANLAGSGIGSISDTLDNMTDNTNDVSINVIYVYTTSLHGCVTTTNVTVAVNPTPHMTSPLTATVCSGAQFSYLDTLSTGNVGVTANWVRAVVPNISTPASSGSHNISEVLTSTILTGATTTYVYTLAYGTCPSHTENLVVSVNPRPGYPQITTHSPIDVCSGTMWQNFGAIAPPPTGVNYSWTADNAEVWATGNTRQYSLVNFKNSGPAVVYLLATLPGFNCPSKDSFDVNVSTSVADHPEVIYFNGDFICLSSDQSTYQWGYDEVGSLDSTLFKDETNQNFTVANPDFTNKYYFVMTQHNGCEQKSYFVIPTGVKNVTANMGDMKVYPNPSEQFVNVEITNTPGGKYFVEVVNLIGQTVNSEEMSGQKTTLDVANLASGVYFINCYRNGVKFATAKFVKN